MPSPRCRSSVGATAELRALPRTIDDPGAMLLSTTNSWGFAHVGCQADSCPPRQAAFHFTSIGRLAGYVEHWNNRRRPTAVCGDFVRFIPLLDGRSLMIVESLPGRAYRLFSQGGRATEKLIGRRWPRPRQPSLEDGRASSQKTATKLRDLADSGADAGPFHLWPPRYACKDLGSRSLECAVVRSRAPSNNTELSGEGPRPSAWTSSAPILCCTAPSLCRSTPLCDGAAVPTPQEPLQEPGGQRVKWIAVDRF